MGGSNSKSDYAWSRRSFKDPLGSVVQDVAKGAPRPEREDFADQLLRLGIIWDGDQILGKQTGMFSSESWVQGFWAGVLVETVDGKERTIRCFLLIDMAALYFFSLSSSNGCCSMKPASLMRIPLGTISHIHRLGGTAESGVPLSFSWTPNENCNQAGKAIWRSTKENVDIVLGKLSDSLALLNFGGPVGEVQYSSIPSTAAVHYVPALCFYVLC